MRLFCFECRKIWGNRIVQRAVLLSVLLDICVISVLAFRDQKSFSISEYGSICEDLEGKDRESANAYMEELTDSCKPEKTGFYTERFQRLTELKDDVNKILTYESYIERIVEAPEKYRQISLFHLNESSYDKAKIEKTAETYAGLQGIHLQVKNTRGTELFLTSRTRLWGILVIMFVCSLAAFFWDRSKGEEQMAFTMYHGRRMRGICKTVALFCTAFTVTFLFFLADYLFFGCVYGFENPNDMVMGVPGFLSTPYAYSIATYSLLLFLSAVMAAFLFAMLWAVISFWIDSAGLIILVSVGLFGLTYMCSYWIQDVSVFRILKYLNPVSLLIGNTLYKTICFINVAGKPVNVIPLVWGISALAAVGLSVVIMFHRSRVKEGRNRKVRIFRHRYSDRLFIHENYRLLYYCRGVIVLVLIGMAAFGFAHYDKEYLTPDEAYYKGYAEACNGQKPEQLKMFLEQEEERIAEAEEGIHKLEERLSVGEISPEAFSFMSAAFEPVLKKKAAFSRLKSRVILLSKTPDASVIYETGYLKLTEPWNYRHIRSYILIFLALLAIVVESEIRDRANGMLSLIESTADGRQRRNKTLSLLHALYVVLLCVIVFSCEIYAIQNSYSLGFAGLKARSIPEWKYTGEMSIRLYLLVSYSFRTACMVIVALGIRQIVSKKRGSAA